MTERWTTKKEGELYRLIVDARGRTIAHLPSATVANHRERALLIAKAPEMLDSLKSFVKLTDEAEAQARWPSGPWLHFCAARALLAELGEGA